MCVCCLLRVQSPSLAATSLSAAAPCALCSSQYAAYGSTKAAVAQLLGTLQREGAEMQPHAVRVVNLSPGMVLTPLLLEGATQRNKKIFNVLCEQPETVAAFLVPRARSAIACGRSGSAIRYLTPAHALAKLLTAPLHAPGKYFDRHGGCGRGGSVGVVEGSSACAHAVPSVCTLVKPTAPLPPSTRRPRVPSRAPAHRGPGGTPHAAPAAARRAARLGAAARLRPVHVRCVPCDRGRCPGQGARRGALSRPRAA